MKSFIRGIDYLLRKLMGIYEPVHDEECLFRLRIRPAHRQMFFPNGRVIHEGEPVVDLHLWNEHFSIFKADRADFAWAIRARRTLIKSFRQVATHLKEIENYQTIRAIVGILSLSINDGKIKGIYLLRRLGFIVVPREASFGKISNLLENFHARLLHWAFMPLKTNRWITVLQRFEAWILMEEFLKRYG